VVFFLAGEVISEKDKCGQCKGQKVVQDKKTLEVHVEKGMQHGQKITFQGEADEAVWFFFLSSYPLSPTFCSYLLSDMH
jgi:hypothetical protein